MPQPQAMARAPAGRTVKDQVAAILDGLKLDHDFFVDKLQSDSAQKLLPQDPDRKDSFQGSKISLSPRPGGKMAAPAVGTGFRRRPSMVARRFPDFDIYLTESLIPVLVQAMDALCRQVAYMEKQDKKLDPRVKARFNPLTWLAQQLLRRHPRVATTPRRMTLYRNFRDWADQERGRRELLRARSKVMEVFNGFLQKGVCGKNSLPFVLAAVDDFFCLRGALKDNTNVQHAVLEGKANFGGRRGSRLGGEGITFDQFWFKFANAIVKHDVITFSMIMHGRELKKLKDQEHEQLMEAARLESERREKEQAEFDKLKQKYEKLYPKLVENEALKAILDGKVLSGEFLKPTDPAFELEVAPHGRHVQLLADLMALLGLEIATDHDGAAELEAQADDGGGNRLFRTKVKKDQIDKEEEPVDKRKAKKQEREKEKEKEKEKERERHGSKGSKDSKGSKEEAPPPEEEEDKAKSDRWWDPSMQSPFKILQDLSGMESTGIVDRKALQEILLPPDKFIDLKKKVDSELERRAERKEVSGEDGDDHSKEIEIKPTMEELSEKYGMARARLDFFHDLFQSFLPPNKDGSPGICGYPENPATLNKKTMFLMLKEINPSLQEAEFEARFRRIDGDGSGLIEFDEFVQWVYDDEVEVVGGAEKVKRTFEELAGDMDVSIRLIEYCYDCFKEELDSGTVDNYPAECATLPKEQACTLAQILVTTLDKKRFDRYWDTVDVQNKGAVTFDFLELLDFEDMPEDVLAKYNDNED